MLEKLFKYWSPGREAKILILGHQKSGTTAIGALLADYCGLTYSNDPLYEVDKGSAKAVKSLVEKPCKLCGFLRFKPSLFCKEVIKDPDYIFLQSQLSKAHPNAKQVFVVRDPRDNIRSLCNRLKLDGRSTLKAPASSDMYKGNRHWELIFSGHLPVLKSANFIESLAKRWCYAAELYLRNKETIILVRYEDFVQDKRKEIGILAEKLGFPQKNSIVEKLDKQFQPRGDNSASHLDFFGEDNLLMINSECREYLSVFGYQE